MAGLSWEFLAPALGNCEVVGELPGVGIRFHIVKCGWEPPYRALERGQMERPSHKAGVTSVHFPLIIFTDDLLLSC